ncbi:hypothetical protein ACCO45_010113 [Purpureocillium lilacinum]|uniref:Uncharacterized protein n=1 Tax=Purpureocillium lilacinum TaxID=33203 RepID=A0ACC4DDX3_PURLI
MSGLDAPEIAAAYEAPAGAQQDGHGGIAELSGALDDGQVQYGYARVEYANDKESTRVKFVLVVWIGEGTKVMRKARVSVESGDVKRALPHHSIAVTASDRADLDEGTWWRGCARRGRRLQRGTGLS